MRSPKFCIDLENPVIDVTSSALTGYISSSHGSIDIYCVNAFELLVSQDWNLGVMPVDIRLNWSHLQ
ncbi:hypothetical protein CsSME_00046230 [Camellia sinensis var. sinensis]